MLEDINELLVAYIATAAVRRGVEMCKFAIIEGMASVAVSFCFVSFLDLLAP